MRAVGNRRRLKTDNHTMTISVNEERSVWWVIINESKIQETYAARTHSTRRKRIRVVCESYRSSDHTVNIQGITGLTVPESSRILADKPTDDDQFVGEMLVRLSSRRISFSSFSMPAPLESV